MQQNENIATAFCSWYVKRDKTKYSPKNCFQGNKDKLQQGKQSHCDYHASITPLLLNDQEGALQNTKFSLNSFKCTQTEHRTAASLTFSLHLQTEETGGGGGEEEARGRGAGASETGTGAKRKREEEAGGKEAADGATPENERGGGTEEER